MTGAAHGDPGLHGIARQLTARPSLALRFLRSAVRHRLVGPATARWRPGAVAMFHIGRCGSTVLTELVEQHPRVYWDGETYDRVFRELKRQGVDRRTSGFLPVEYVLDRLERSGSRWFGFDLKPYHSTEFGVPIEDYIAGLRAGGVDHFVRLERRNYLRKAVSTVNGARRDSYHRRKGERVGLSPLHLDPTDVFLDVYPGSLLEHFERYDDWYRRFDHSTAGARVLRLSYEDHIETDPRVAAAEVLRFLDLEPGALEVTLRRMNPEPLHELLSNYDEVASYLDGTPYAWMPEDG